MKNFFNSKENIFLIKIVFIILSFFLIFMIINHITLKSLSIRKTKDYLKQTADKIIKDIKIKNNKLDVASYFQDTSLPYDIPIYIFTKEGFVIERMNRIQGFLDTANFEYAESFKNPTTITTQGNITWRVYSYPIIRNNATEGSILIAYYNPKQTALQEIDDEIHKNADKIESLILFENNKLDVSQILSKDISYDIYFQIVDKFNKLLIDDGAPPSYIDRSYVAKYLEKKEYQEVIGDNKEKFLIYIEPIKSSESLGVIIVGMSIKDFELIISQQQKFILISSLALLILITLVFVYLKKELSSVVEDKTEKSLKELDHPKYLNPKRISFDEKGSCLYFDDQSVKIEYATKQYDFCKILFLHSKKRWENDELQEKLGLNEEDVHERTFYDLKEIINKKIYPILGKKMILYENKTYYINPDLVEKIIKK